MMDTLDAAYDQLACTFTRFVLLVHEIEQLLHVYDDAIDGIAALQEIGASCSMQNS